MAAHVNRSLALLPYLGAGNAAVRPANDSGPLPPDNSERSWSLITGVVRDAAPWFKKFGDVLSDVAQGQYSRGDTVGATFVGANPRNNLRLEGTYAAVEFRREAGDPWETARDDSDWGLVYRWRRTGQLRGTSEVDIVWDVEEWAAPGEYRLRYYGDAKSLLGRVRAFEGVSEVFRVG